MGKNKKFKCPHCGKVINMSELEIMGFGALTSMMPGPKLLHPEGTIPCKYCYKAIDVKDIIDGKYNVASRVLAAFQLLVAIIIIAVLVHILC